MSSHNPSCDSNTDFDPIDLDMHVTPANVAAAMSEGDHMQGASLMNLRVEYVGEIFAIFVISFCFVIQKRVERFPGVVPFL